MRPPDVVGLGFASLDTVGLVPRLPGLDEGLLLDDLTCQGGGPVAQAMVTLARLGASAAFVGRVGDDAAGDAIRAGLQAEGVEIARLRVEPGATSPQCIILVDAPSGKRSICCAPGTASPVAAAELDLGYLLAGRFLHLDGHSTEAALVAARAAHRAGVAVCLDAGGPGDHLLELVPHVDVLIAAGRFVASVADDGTCETGAAWLLTMGPKIVVVTRGERGSSTFTRDDEFATPAFRVHVVDTTGAGDVFHGAYLFGLLRSWDLATTAAFAGAAAALKCTKLGGRAGIPRLPEVLSMLREQGGSVDVAVAMGAPVATVGHVDDGSWPPGDATMGEGGGVQAGEARRPWPRPSAESTGAWRGSSPTTDGA